MANLKIKIGDVMVDSGQMMVGDPCYLHDFKAGEFDPNGPKTENGEYSYDGASRATLYGQNLGGVIGEGRAVCVSSGYGDGTYPVHVEIKEGRVKRLIVTFF
jgi:hypothetical protein